MEGIMEGTRWVSAVPMVRTERGTWSKVHYNEDGTIGEDVTAEKADAICACRVYMLEPTSGLASAAMRAATSSDRSE